MTGEMGATRLAAATRGTYVSFIVNGFAIASWAARIPQVRDHFHLRPVQLGLVLLAISLGTFVTLPLSGMIVHRFTSRATVIFMSLLAGAALIIVSAGYLVGLVPMVAGLVLFGVAVGAWDPAQNVQGAVVERRLGRAIMPRFHAAFSVGTVIGALAGVAAVALSVPVPVHLLLVAVVVGMVVPIEARHFLQDIEEEPSVLDGGAGSPLGRWLEPRTLAIGMFVLAFAFTEGVGTDWIAVSLIDGYGAPAVVGTLAYSVFLAGMTNARWFGGLLLDRYGRVATVRILAVVAIVGVLLCVSKIHIGLAVFGALLWGVGASLGFPTGMSAAADEPAAAAGRVSVVASVGYLAFLGGPPTIGFLGEHLTILGALVAVVVMLAASMLLSGALAPTPSDTTKVVFQHPVDTP